MGQADAFFGFEKRRCYGPPEWTEGDRVKRVNLLTYFELAETLSAAKVGVAKQNAKGGDIYIALAALPKTLLAFVDDDNGFSTCKHAARDLVEVANLWIAKVWPDGKFSAEEFDKEYPSWQFGEVNKQIDSFRSVFEAECRDVDVYSVGQIGIYKTSALVSAASVSFPEDIRARMSNLSLAEFNNAGRCLAFSLPTACGFHALRGLELVMDDYLDSYGIVTAKFKSWMDYITAAKKLIDDVKTKKKPSPKVAAMLDRMRELDRNPLMHPRDTLDEMGADQLFKLCAVTVVEMIKEMNATAMAEDAAQTKLLEALEVVQ